MKNTMKFLMSIVLFGSLLTTNIMPIKAVTKTEEETHILVRNSYLNDPQDITATTKPEADTGKVKGEKKVGYASAEDEQDNIVTIKHTMSGKSALVDNPINVIVVMDCSENMDNQIVNAESEHAKSLARYLLAENPRNKVAAVYGGARICRSQGFTSDYATLDGFLKHIAGLPSDFDALLGQVGTFIKGEAANVNKNCPLYTIFITAGTGNVTSNYKTDLFGLFSMHTVYGIGIRMSTPTPGINQVATPGKAYACPKLTDFENVMKNITSAMREGYAKDLKLSETINEHFDLLIDAAHPVIIDGKSYTSKDTLPAGFVFANNKLTVSLGDLKEKATDHTLTYSVKEIADNTVGVDDVTKDAVLSYKPANITSNDIVYPSTPTTQTLYNPTYTTEESKITASLSSNLETGTVIPRDAAVSYTLDITNRGKLDLENFYANIEIPEGMEYLSAEEPVFGEASAEAGKVPETSEDEPLVAEAAEDEDLGLDIEGEDEEIPAEEESVEDKAGYDPDTGKVYFKIENLEKDQRVSLTVNVKPNEKTESMTAVAGIGLTEESNIKTNAITHTLEEIVEEIKILPPNEPVAVKKPEKKATGTSEQNYMIAAGFAALLLLGAFSVPHISRKNKR